MNIFLKTFKDLLFGPDEVKIPAPLKNLKSNVKLWDLALRNRYKTNLLSMTCNCPEFTKYQHYRYRKNDIRRLCTHLVDLYKEKINFSDASIVNQAIINNGFSVRGNYQIIDVRNEETGKITEVGITFNRDNPWIDVFAPNEKNEYKRYGYSIDSYYWAKKEKPYLISEPIENYIKKNI